MKTKLVSLFIATLALFSACQSESIEPQEDDSRNTNNSTPRFQFPDGWQHMSLPDRIAFLQIPDDLLPTMSSAELAEACLTYPGGIDCFAFNSVQFGIERIISRFNGFAELKKHDDAFDKVLDYFDKRLNKIASLSTFDNSNLQEWEIGYCERFIISGYLLPVDELKNNQKVLDIYYKAEKVNDKFNLQGKASSSLFAMKIVLGLDPEITELTFPYL